MTATPDEFRDLLERSRVLSDQRKKDEAQRRRWSALTAAEKAMEKVPAILAAPTNNDMDRSYQRLCALTMKKRALTIVEACDLYLDKP